MFKDKLKQGSYNTSESYVSKENNAYYLQDARREPDENEKTAAKFLVKAGISVEFTPEGIRAYATAIKPDGTSKYADGKVAVFTFEQKTIDKSAQNITNNFRNGIDHAVSKGAEVAVIFDRFGLGHKKQIEEAIKTYKLPKFGKMPKAVIVINKNGDIYEHHF